MLVSVLPDSWPSAAASGRFANTALAADRAPGGPAERQHINALTVHGVNSAKMKRMFADAE
jgi:hypothetical protein